MTKVAVVTGARGIVDPASLSVNQWAAILKEAASKLTLKYLEDLLTLRGIIRHPDDGIEGLPDGRILPRLGGDAKYLVCGEIEPLPRSKWPIIPLDATEGIDQRIPAQQKLFLLERQQEGTFVFKTLAIHWVPIGEFNPAQNVSTSIRAIDLVFDDSPCNVLLEAMRPEHMVRALYLMYRAQSGTSRRLKDRLDASDEREGELRRYLIALGAG